MLDGDLLKRKGQRRRLLIGPPLQRDVHVEVRQRPGKVDPHAQLRQQVEGIEHIGGDAGVGAQANAETEDGELGLAVQPEVPIEMNRLPTDQGVVFDPCLERDLHRPKLPTSVVTDSTTEGN